MEFLDPYQIRQQYKDFIPLLEEIFGEGNIHPVSDFSPNKQSDRGPLGITNWDAGSASEDVYPLARRLFEYVVARQWNAEEEAKGERTRQYLGFWDDLVAGTEVVGHAGVMNIPKIFFETPTCLPRINEFILGMPEETDSRSSPDEAAVSLSAFTGVSWHIAYSDGPSEFRQLRLETERPVANAQTSAESLQQELGLPKHVFVDKASHKLFIPVIFLPPPEVIQELRRREWQFEAPSRSAIR